MDQIWWTFLKMLIALPLVLFMVMLILRYNLKPFRQQSSQNRMMRVVDRLILDKNTSICLVELQGVYYFLGTQQGNLTVLDKLESINLDGLPLSEENFGFEQILGEKLQKASRNVKSRFYQRKGKNHHEE